MKNIVLLFSSKKRSMLKQKFEIFPPYVVLIIGSIYSANDFSSDYKTESKSWWMHQKTGGGKGGIVWDFY